MIIAEKEFSSRLIMGSGGATSMDLLEKALVASGTEMTTVAMRRHASGTPIFPLLTRLNICASAQYGGVPYRARTVITARLRAKPWGQSGLRLR